jgi:4-methylaminobutanoate oxidase (formaldehyde-forming)
VNQVPPASAQVVIVGGGVIGASVAYHLTKLGLSDVVLVEQGQLSCGTTWHASGLLGQLRATEAATRLVQYSAALYRSLEEETGLATGYKGVGGITIARSPDRVTQLQRTAATAEAFGLDCELVDPHEAQAHFPLLDLAGVLAALWLPGDAVVNATDVTASMARGARSRGAQVFEQTRVTEIVTERGAAVGVITDKGAIAAEVVVNCGGQWAKAIGELCGVSVPLHSAEHFYVVTEQIDGVKSDLPILRDPDGYTYIREEVGGLLVGGFEPVAKPWVAPDQIPYPFEFQLLDEDWEHFSILMESAVRQIPVLATTGIRKFYNGPESFTPDNQFILGEAPELKNFFVAAGFNSLGIATAGGAGKALAEWIVGGEPSSDLAAVDIRRFAAFNGNNQWLHDRVGEVLGLHYAVPWPNRELETARPFRRSPIYPQLVEARASFGSKLGWERANFFAAPGAEPRIDYAWGKQNWLEWSAGEQRATRQAVALYDQTSFGKLLIEGRDAERLLQQLCTADVAVQPGTTVYTGMLNSRAGYEADVTLTRLAYDEYLLVTSAGSPVRDRDWIERHRSDDMRVVCVDLTSAYAVYGVMGPSSRQLLSTLSRSDLSDEAFPFATSREIDLGYSTVRATRLTYVGELGWELYVPTEFAVGVYELLMEAGKDLGIANAGYYALNSLRLEKGYRAWGSDLGPDYNPLEAGLLFTCKLDTDHDFIGRAALERARVQGRRRSLVSFKVSDPRLMLWGGELLLRDGVPSGQVTSAAWSETLQASVGLGYLWTQNESPVSKDFLAMGHYEINAGGQLDEITISRRALYDPQGTKIHC